MERASRLTSRQRYVISQAFIVSLTTLLAAIILIPIYWMINAALRPITEILVYAPKLIPTRITFEYFAGIVANPMYRRFYLNSVLISSFTTVVTICLATLAAYGFSRFRMPGRQAMLMSVVALLMLPRVTLIIPYFKLSHTLGIYDTLAGLILVNTAFILPVSTWLLKGYMDSVPIELEEAAMIDGCSRLQALRKIVFPALVPGMVGAGTYVFISSWNEYLLSVVLTDTPSSQPLTIGLALFFGQFIRDWSSIMALATMASLPLVLIFIFFQRYVVQGMTSGAVK